MEDLNQEQEDFSNIEFDIDSFRGIAPWYFLLILRFWPSMGVRLLCRKFGFNDAKANQAHKLFDDVEKIDIHSLTSDRGRGFMLTLDRKMALFFYQDGDAFTFDGFEVGEYTPGNIQIFDHK